MLISLYEEAGLVAREACDSCDHETPVIEFHGYSEGSSDIQLCGNCALQLARKLLEDLCDLAGNRYG